MAKVEKSLLHAQNVVGKKFDELTSKLVASIQPFLAKYSFAEKPAYGSQDTQDPIRDKILVEQATILQIVESSAKTLRGLLKTRIALFEEMLPQNQKQMDLLIQNAKAQHIAVQDKFNSYTKALHPALSFDLSEPDWANHDFSQHILAKEIFAFYTVDERTGIRYPVIVPFLDSETALHFTFNTLERKLHAHNAMHSLVMRICAMMPYSSMFCLLDPSGMGGEFPYLGQLQSTRFGHSDTARLLEDVVDDIRRISGSVLSTDAKRLIDVDAELRSGEKFEFIVAANFPHGYDRRSIELLAQIANNGARAGKHVILLQDTEADFPNGVSIGAFKTLKHPLGDLASKEKTYYSSVSDSVISDLLGYLAKGKPKEANLEFKHLVDLDATETWWKGDASQVIQTSIGGAGGRKNDLALWFGHSKDGRTCSHGMLGATTGAGKSNLYHVFIMTLACRYSPEELQFYLIDGKQGVEFQNYPQLPHARVVSLKTEPELARSVLAELVDEMERRNELFKSLKVEDIFGYRAAGSPSGKLPRLLLIVDEFQTLFEDDRDGVGSELMYKLSGQGRSAGIHMFVGSQRFGAPDMTKQTAIFGNMHLRVGMNMSEADVTALQEFGPEGKKQLRACKEKGQVVVNDGLGDDRNNKAGRVAFLERETQKKLLAQLRAKWEQEYPEQADRRTILLDGSGQPSIIDNPQLRRLLKENSTRPATANWQTFANAQPHEGGLGEAEWYPVEHPTVMWLGQEMNIHGHARLIMRRRAHEHLIVVGDSNEARLGLLGYALAQLPLNHRDNNYRLLVLDRSIKGSPWSGAIQFATEQASKAGNNFHEKFPSFSLQLEEVKAELERRRSMDEERMLEEPSIYVVFNDAQRLNDIQKPEVGLGSKSRSDANKLLTDLLEHGGEFGIHLITTFDTMRSVNKVFERREIEGFRHKIALQMSEEDSFSLMKTRRAARLQLSGKTPIYALYLDQMQNRPLVFKPYCYISNDEQSSEEIFTKTINMFLKKIAHWDDMMVEQDDVMEAAVVA